MNSDPTETNPRRLSVRLFAAARQCAGRETIDVTLPPGATIATLRQGLGREVPALAEHLPFLLFAIGTEYAQDGDLIPNDCELSAFPPVSGG